MKKKLSLLLILALVFALSLTVVGTASAEVAPVTYPEVFQGEYEGENANVQGKILSGDAFIVFGTVSPEATEYGVELTRYGDADFVTATGSLFFEGKAKDDSGKFGIALFNVPDGFYTARVYEGEEKVYGENVYFAQGETLVHDFTSLTIETEPEKSVYELGETLDTTGLVTKAHCSRCGKDFEVKAEVEEKSLVKGVNTITVSYGELEDSFEVEVWETHEEVVKAGDAIYGGTYEFDVTGINGAIETLTVGSQTATEGFTHSGTALTVSPELMAVVLNGKQYGDFTANVTTDTYDKYELAFSVVTKKLATAQDLADMTAANTADVIDGYYIVTADIDASTAGAVRFVNNNTTTHDGNKNINADKGFKGIFDGRGHVISNVATAGGGYRTMGGLFGQFTTGGTVRNVAFTNVTTTSGHLFSGDGSSFGGTVENVVITTNTSGSKVFSSLTGGSLKNFLVVGVAQINLNTGKASVANVMSVTTERRYGGFSWTGNDTYDAQPNYASTQDMLTALASENLLAGWNSPITYADGAISFNGKTIVVPEVTLTAADTTVTIGGSLEITSNSTLSIKTPIEGVTLTGNTLSVANTVAEDVEITIVATSDLNAKYTKEITVTTIRNYTPVDMTATRYADIIASDDTSVLTLTAEMGNVLKIKVGETLYADNFSQNGTALTINKAIVTTMLNGKAYGDNFTMTLYTDANKAYAINLSVVTKKLATAQDLADMTAANTASVIDGYYIVTANIDASTAGIVRVVNNNTQASDTVGFKGIFDGRGHVISNLQTSCPVYNGLGGVFGQILADGIVRNIAFTNISVVKDTSVSENNYNIALLGESRTIFGKIENLLVTKATLDGYALGQMRGTGSVKNMFVAGFEYMTVDSCNVSVDNIASMTKWWDYYGGFAWISPDTEAGQHYRAQPTFKDKATLLSSLAENNIFAAWDNSLITYANGKVYFGETVIYE